MILIENKVITDDEVDIVRELLKSSKNACLHIQNEYPRGFNSIQEGAPKSAPS